MFTLSTIHIYITVDVSTEGHRKHIVSGAVYNINIITVHRISRLMKWNPEKLSENHEQ